MRPRLALGTVAVAVLLLVLAGLADPGAPATTPALGGGRWWLGVGVLALQAAVVARGVGSPAGLVAVTVGVPLGAAVGLHDAIGVTVVAVAVAAYAVVAARPRPPWPALLAAVGVVAAGHALAVSSIAGGLTQGVGVVGLAGLVGVVVRSRREAGAARKEAHRAGLREQEARWEAHAARERTAMARELHDIAAHHLSGIAITTGALDRQIDTDPAGAKVAAREVRRQSTELLRDLRRLVSLLREDPSPDALVVAESLTGVPSLVVAATRAGATVRLEMPDDLAAVAARVGPLAQLTAYRVVQESLANAARHAPGAPVTVTIADAERVEIAVRNAAPTSPARATGGGFGLVGMRERAELVGATLTAGPADGGWLVALTLPTEEKP